MRAHSSIALAALLLAFPASAADLELGVRFQTEYNDNVLSSGDGKNDDAIFTLAPYGRVNQRAGQVRWDLLYRPSYVAYLETSGLDGLQHEFAGNAHWQIDERTSLQVSDRFARLLSRGRFNQSTTLESGEVVSEAELGVRNYQRNIFSASLNRLFDRGHSMRGRLSHSATNFDVGRDASSLSLNLSYRYQISPRSLLAIGPRYSRQEVAGEANLDDSATDFYGLTGTWQHVLDRGLTLTLSAGPTWIDTNSSNTRATVGTGPKYPLQNFGGVQLFSRCPEGDDEFSVACLPDFSVLPDFEGEPNSDPELEFKDAPSTEDTRLTFFANASIEKDWQRWSSSLSYRRQESPSSGLGAASITDAVTGLVTWRPRPRWNLRWVATVTRRTQATESLRGILLVAPCNGPAPTDPVCEFNAPDLSARTTGIRLATVDLDDRLDQFIGRFSVSYRLRERITLDGNLYYLDQTQSGDRLVDDLNVSRFTAWFGIRWQLDPIPLPF